MVEELGEQFLFRTSFVFIYSAESVTAKSILRLDTQEQTVA